MTYTLGSLFDGSGGFPLAGTLCGIVPKWAAEVEPYPIAVTRSRFPNMKHFGDVSKIRGNEIEPVDIITFGSPCQDLSVAGKRAGLKHEANGDDETTRSGLFMEAVRIIKEMREATDGKYPSFALWENVPGAFSSNGGEDFRIVCEELIKIVEPSAVMPEVPTNGWAYADSYVGDGWSLSYRVFDAQYWGVPQRRRRIHLVLDLRGERAREVLFEREGLRGYFETGRTPWEGTASDAEGGAGADDRAGENGGSAGERGLARLMDAYQHHGWRENDVCGTLTAGQNDTVRGDTPLICFPVVANTLAARADGSPQPDKKSGANVVVQGVVATCQNTGIGWWNESPIGQTLRTPCGGDSTMANVVIEAFAQNQREEVRDLNGIAVTLNAQAGMHQQTFVAIADTLPFDTTQVTSPQNGNNPKWGDPCHPLAAQGHPPTVICKVQHLFENHSQDTRYKGPLDVSPMLPAQLGTSGNNTPFVVEENTPVYCLQGSMIGRADKNGPQGDGVNEGESFTLNTIDRHAVVYAETYQKVTGPLMANSHPGSYCGQDAYTDMLIVGKTAAHGVDCRNLTEHPELYPTLQAKPNGGQSLNYSGACRINYIVRRLTPTECARLQGFADRWGEIDQKDDFTDEEFQFWLDVRNTHAAINGKTVKDYTETQMLNWYNKLHTDSAEYKMWGNGIALPPALYCMQGITYALEGVSDEWML